MNGSERTLARVLEVFVREGELRVTFNDGTTAVFGSGAPAASLHLRSATAARELLQAGVLGFAEAYIGGRVETDDLRPLLRWGAANQGRWASATTLARPLRGMWQRLAATNRLTRVATMADHYNLGNEFYAAWLDDSMTYSSARFPTPHASLAVGQQHKYRTIADHAGLVPGMRILEIGCGWGGFAMYAAAERDVYLTCLTIAEEQATYARKRLAGAGLIDRVDVQIRDFRTVAGTFDAVVSIEMIESVDETAWPDLFDAFARSLAPGGLVALQAITISDALFDAYRRGQDFIQRYIFPGGQCPAPSILRRQATEHGLALVGREQFGLDYARTLQLWAERFEAAWPALRAAGFDERFRRMWLLYMAYCEAGFRQGSIDVEQWTLEG